MKAVAISGSGDPREVLKLTEVDDLPAPTGSDTIVRITKRVIHAIDYQVVRGSMPVEMFADRGLLGVDGVGVVEAVGPDVDPSSGIAVGMRVIASHARRTWAERAIVPLAELIPLPDDIDDAVASQFATNGVTAVLVLRAAERSLAAADKKAPLLVTAAGSGVALTLIGLAWANGHEVVALVRREADASIVAEHFEGLTVIGTDREGWQDRVRTAATEPLRVALDPIGGEMTATLLGVLAPGGEVIAYGALDPKPAPIFPGFMTAFGLSVRGYSAAGWSSRSSRQERNEVYASLFHLARKSPHLFDGYTEFPFAKAAEAIDLAASSPRRGATILASP